MSKTLRAGLAWGTPVKPDQLLTHLAAYKRTLPALQAIRLAHRFGTGPQVHITKLPVEMLLLIEDFVIEAQRQRWDPYIESELDCFESKCEPRHHWVEEDDLWDYAGPLTQCQPCEEEVTKGSYSHKNCDTRCTKDTAEPCETCSDGGMGAENCERNCHAKWEDSVNRVAQESEYNYECHEERKGSWLARINKTEFLPYEKMLKQHFGLEAYLASTVVDGNNEGRWPKHKSHRYHDSSELKTTLCYLTLPKRLAPEGVFHAEEAYGDIPDSPDAAQAIEVEIHSLSITDEQRRRFQRALKTLGLEVYLHPSQAHAYTVTPDLSLEEDSSEESGSRNSKDAAGGQWPRLLLLVKSS
ncbi:hypothetical protein LTR56_006322 [Elasticomyces elasticus]|nr:hypothetical protein LTR56_006322 [Elasticomyces elasticus]KAK3663370.1 hypothetical protein LTR22_005777 [Elasticomyces elasticus]